VGVGGGGDEAALPSLKGAEGICAEILDQKSEGITSSDVSQNGKECFS